METATLHTMDTLEVHLKEHGFSALMPGKNDLMGDTWSRAILSLFNRTVEAEGIGSDENKHQVWLIFQSLYCTFAGMAGRIIASPRSMEMAGITVSCEMRSDAIRLLIASQGH